MNFTKKKAAQSSDERFNAGNGRKLNNTITNGIERLVVSGVLLLASMLAQPDSAFANEFPLKVSLSHLDEGDVMCVGNGTHRFDATVTRSDNGQPVDGKTITFSSNGGTLDPIAVNADQYGNASTTLKNVVAAGTLTVTATVSWAANGATGTIAGTATEQLTVHAIGGPITGSALARYECKNDSGHYTVRVANQPSGTSLTWSWSNSTGVGQVGFVDPTNATDITAWAGLAGDHSVLTFRGKAASYPRNDVKIKVIYSKNNFDCESEYSVTVLKPASLTQFRAGFGTVNPYRVHYPPDAKAYGFEGQWILWQLLDQFTGPLGSEVVTEEWGNPGLPDPTLPTHGPITVRNGRSWQTNNAPGGQFDGVFNSNDDFLYFGMGRDADGNLLFNITAPAERNCFTIHHRFRAGDANPTIGCLVGDFNTTWSNRRVTH